MSDLIEPDDLAAVIAKANDEFQAENAAFSIPYEARRAGAIKAIAAAVRSFMGSPETVEAIKLGIAADVLAVMDDYSEVPPEHIFTRPRYDWIRMRLDAIARAALSAAIGEDIGGERG